MKTGIKKLNELIENDFELKLEIKKFTDIDKINYDNNFKKGLTVTQLQIINKLLEYYEYEPIFDFIDEPSEQLIYEYLNDYAQNIIDKFDLNHGCSEIEFRTDDHGDLDIKRLLKENIESTGMYVILNAPNNSTVMAEIEFNEFDEESESIADYLQKTSDDLYDEIKKRLFDFDPDEEFDELWAPGASISARQMLRILDEDQEFFEEVANRM